ncbi:hypothetical protein DVH24_007306 [Malus domestica]|uniref:D-aminoacyl-tRNA deacylase n=1 Tax=Malus domestica TaxID=3750 RepID=A0A498HH41_MALDO|nr:hypothetical protein DVH24_007306 [Malus domestica]
MKGFANGGGVRVLLHNRGIVEEDDLDRRWEEATGERVNEVIFLSKHTAVSNRPALTVHPIGIPHLREGEAGPQGGKPGWAAPPSSRIGPWLRHLKKLAQFHNLVPEFEITLEGTHHGPVTNIRPLCGTHEYWKRQDAVQLVWEGLGLGGGAAVGNWNGEKDKNKILLGLGGGHYAPRHMDIVLKDGVWVGHLLSGYSLPMEDPNQSFKSWQKNAITAFLGEQNIKIGKPNDFY